MSDTYFTVTLEIFIVTVVDFGRSSTKGEKDLEIPISWNSQMM